MKIIGLCGGSGSGKGTICQIFQGYGIPAIDTDAVYRDLTEGPSECLAELVSYFGDSIISDGALNRSSLASIVFAKGAEHKLAALNAITHKHILAKTREVISGYIQSGAPAVIVDAPLLFESCFDKECDIIISVVADLDTKISRIMQRDGISRDAASRRIASQKSDEWLVARSDYVIYNNGNLEDLTLQIAQIVNKIL